MKIEQTALISKIWQVLTSSERRGLVVLMVLITFGTVLEALGVSMVVPAIVLITQDDIGVRYPAVAPLLDWLGNPTQESLVVWGLTSLVGIYFVKAVYLSFLAFVQTRFIFNVRLRVAEQLFHTYLTQPWTFHLQRNSSQLMRNILSETQQLTQSALTPMMRIVTELLLLAGLLTILLIAEPVGALSVGLILGLASLAFYGSVRRPVNRWGQVRQHHEQFVIQHLQQGLNGVKDVKLLGRESEFVQHYRDHNQAATRMIRNQNLLSQMPRLWLEFLAVVGLAVLVASMLYRGGSLESVLPTLALFAAVAFRMMPSANKLVSSLQQLRFSTPAVDAIYEELKLVIPQKAPAKSHEDGGSFEDKFSFEQVRFCYPDTESPAVDDVSLDVFRGESVGLIGASGSGKSTLVDLFLGILDPSEGRICMDDVNVHDSLRNWQRQIGYVPQTIYLTDDTLRRNIAFGLSEEEIDNGAVTRAVEAAQLDGFVDSLPEGLETIVGEHGVRLSGGQRQRIGIARALYHDPEVLVLDEATSALDNATEVDVMKAITALHGKKTILIVAHRLTTVANCDRIYRLDGGRIVQTGSAEEVLKNQEVAVIGNRNLRKSAP